MSDVVELAEVPELFERWLAGRPLAERSRREYARNVRAYCTWLAERPDRDGWQGDPLVAPDAAVCQSAPTGSSNVASDGALPVPLAQDEVDKHARR